jgi:hypothetical protein
MASSASRARVPVPAALWIGEWRVVGNGRCGPPTEVWE